MTTSACKIPLAPLHDPVMGRNRNAAERSNGAMNRSFIVDSPVPTAEAQSILD